MRQVGPKFPGARQVFWNRDVFYILSTRGFPEVQSGMINNGLAPARLRHAFDVLAPTGSMAHEIDLHTAGSIAFGLAVLVGLSNCATPVTPTQGKALGVSADRAARGARCVGPGMVAQPDRPLRLRQDGGRGDQAGAGGRPADFDPPALSRPDRSAAEPDEVQAFLDDKSPDAVARVVDRLLASPQYGERWARHWLDVVRFAETNGYERDGAKPNAWRYRDYVIDALNRDKPYSRFLTEQLAGDEIEGSDATAQIATTFLRLGTWDDEPAEPKVDRYDQLDDVLGTAATAFLGITLRCARCHDHKFEPFSQADYYRMLAVFEPLKRPQNDRTDLDRPVGTEAELAAYDASLARTDAEFAATWARIEGLIKPEIDRLLAPPKRSKRRQGPAQADVAAAARRRTRSALAAAEPNAGSSRARQAFAAKLVAEARELAPDEVAAALSPAGRPARRHRSAAHKELPRAYIWYEEGPKAPVTHVLKRGNPDQQGVAASRGCPPCWPQSSPSQPRPTAQVDRSQALAGALADQPRKPPGGARDRQPDLAVPFRPGIGGFVQRSRRHGRSAHPSRAARLAGLGARWPPAGGSSRCTA